MNSPVNLKAFFQKEFAHNEDGLDEFISNFKTERYTANEYILKAGQMESKLKYLVSGNVREFYSTSEKEININFCTSPQFITDFSSFNNQIASQKFQQCLSSVELKTMNKTTFITMLDKYECGKSIVEQTFQKLLMKKEAEEHRRLTKDAAEMYKDILAKKPDWLLNIPQYHIASYLGITPETLSRIRKRIS